MASRYSRKDYTQPQFFALLVLRRQFLRTDYRGVVALVARVVGATTHLGLSKGAPLLDVGPHASHRILTHASWGAFIEVQAAVVRRRPARGLIDRAPHGGCGRDRPETRHVSAHFGQRPSQGRRAHGNEPGPTHRRASRALASRARGCVPGVGPSQDSPTCTPAMRRSVAASGSTPPSANAGYDAEHNHRLCRESSACGRTFIRLNRRNTGSPLAQDTISRRAHAVQLPQRPPTTSACTSRAGSVSTNAVSRQP
jgi:hypothetical protein